MKKSYLQLLVLLLATFLLSSSKTVAKDVPLGPVNFDQEQEYEYWTWKPFNYVDDLVCKKEEVRFPLISPLKPKNSCTHEDWSGNKYSFLGEDLNEREINSIN